MKIQISLSDTPTVFRNLVEYLDDDTHFGYMSNRIRTDQTFTCILTSKHGSKFDLRFSLHGNKITASLYATVGSKVLVDSKEIDSVTEALDFIKKSTNRISIEA